MIAVSVRVCGSKVLVFVTNVSFITSVQRGVVRLSATFLMHAKSFHRRYQQNKRTVIADPCVLLLWVTAAGVQQKKGDL